MTTLTTTDELVRSAERYRVYLRQRWADAWTLEPFLECLSVCWSASPKVSAAEFQWIYGRGMRQGETGFSDVAPRALLDWYVKVEIDQPDTIGDEGFDETVPPLVWVGLIQEDGDNPRGARIGEDSAGESRVPRGRQALLAYGLEVLLDLEPVTTSFVETSEGCEAKPVGRGLTFNEENHQRPATGLDRKHHYKMPGNRSKQVASQTAYVFAKDATDACIWTVPQIVDYLIRYHAPTGDAVPFRLDLTRRICLPDWGRPKVASHGRSVKHLLDELMDRRRLLGYTVEVEADYYGAGMDAMMIRPFTFADQDLTVPDSEDPDLIGQTLKANPDQVSLDFDRAIDVEAVHLKMSSVDLYDQAIATGARVVCCGTISGLEETLVGHWSNIEESDYNGGASLEADYAALDDFAKQERNKVARAEKRLERVYAYFGLAKDWDGKVDTELTEEKNTLFPFTQLGLDPAQDLAFHAAEMRFLPTIPLKTNHDYTADKIATDQVADNTPEGYAWENRPIYVLLKLADNPCSGDRYAEVDKMAAAAGIEGCGAGDGRNFSCSIRVQEHAAGIVLRVSGGQGQYTIARTDFASLPGLIDEYAGEFDWRDNLIVTFAVEADRSVEMRWPKTVVTQWDFQRILRIDASARCGLHYVAPNTVVDCKDGYLRKSTNGGFVRDDRPLLQLLAHTAYQWYATPRQAFTFVFRQASGLLKVGQLITTIGALGTGFYAGGTQQDVRSVVTQVRIDLAHSDHEFHRTTVETQWAELDVMKLL